MCDIQGIQFDLHVKFGVYVMIIKKPRQCPKQKLQIFFPVAIETSGGFSLNLLCQVQFNITQSCQFVWPQPLKSDVKLKAALPREVLFQLNLNFALLLHTMSYTQWFKWLCIYSRLSMMATI